MTNISPATVAAAMTSPVTPNPTNPDIGTADTGTSALNTDFETFLKMLTAQAQNQDPLNPIDSSDYATQLATFSSVEQQVMTNDLLSTINTQFGNMGMSQMAHWVGMEARVDAPALFTGSAIDVFPEFDALAETATLVVKDQNGQEVQRVTVSPEQDVLSWTGQDDDGQLLPDGLYSFSVESYAADRLLQSLPARVYSRIDEIQNQGGSISLLMTDGSRVSADEVDALRNPGLN